MIIKSNFFNLCLTMLVAFACTKNEDHSSSSGDAKNASGDNPAEKDLAIVLQDCHFTVDKKELPFNKLFSLTVSAAPQTPPYPACKITGFNAVMPEHGHGMFTKPVVQYKDNKHRIDGIKLHMRGKWKLIFEVTRGKTFHKVEIPYIL